MKTKTSILAALIAMAGSASLMAQTVYSLNVVGYITTNVPPGFSLIANQLTAANNTIPALFPNVPNGTTIYKYNNGTSQFTINQYDAEFAEWSDAAQTLLPGEGAFILNPTGTNVPLTFVGEVVTGNQTNSLPAGYSLKSSIVPQQGALQGQLGYVPQNGDTVFRWQNNTSQYAIHQYDAEFAEWTGGDPVLNVGEGFFLQRTSGGQWVRNFNPNN